MLGAAKVSGVGARIDVSGLSLAYPPYLDKLTNFMRKAKLQFQIVQMGEAGVGIE